jgi:hypothetical protein
LKFVEPEIQEQRKLQVHDVQLAEHSSNMGLVEGGNNFGAIRG